MTNLDVFSTVSKMNSQGMMMVETREQYMEIFQSLKDEVTCREPPGYIDLSTEKLSFDYGGDDEFIYNEGEEEDNYDNYEGGEYNTDQGGYYYY